MRRLLLGTILAALFTGIALEALHRHSDGAPRTCSACELASHGVRGLPNAAPAALISATSETLFVPRRIALPELRAHAASPRSPPPA